MGINLILVISIVGGAIVVKTALEEPVRVQSLLNDRGVFWKNMIKLCQKWSSYSELRYDMLSNSSMSVLLPAVAEGNMIPSVSILHGIWQKKLNRGGFDNATKRNALNFAMMIREVTRRTAWDFNGYGCWCGYGGKGQPVNDLDRCCYVHDMCYNRLQSDVCPFKKAVYTLSYSTEKGRPLKCKPSSYYWYFAECRHELCKCDAEAVRCFARSHYDWKYKNYPQKHC